MNQSSIKMNFIYNIIYQVLLVLLPLITSPYISRVLSDDGLGIYSYQYTIANCFALIGMLGVNSYGNRSIAVVRDNRAERSRVFLSIWIVQLIVSIITCFIYSLYIVVGCEKEYRIVAIMLYLTVLASIFDINWFFFGLERFKLTVTRNILIKILSIICIFIFVKSKSDVWIYSLIIAGSLLISNLAVWPFLKREVDFEKVSIKDISKHIPQMFVLFIPVIAVTLYNKMDKVMLGNLSTMSETGFYENTEKIINIPTGIITALGTVMLPRMSYLFANNNEEIAKKYFELSMEFACSMSCALAFGIAAIARDFAPWFFGELFREIDILIIVLAPKILFLSVANVLRTQYLIPLHKDKDFLNSVWVGAIVNLVLNALLISKYGALGAVVGTLVAEFTVMAYQIFAVSKTIPIYKYLWSNLYYLIIAIVMFTLIIFLRNYVPEGFIGILFQIILGIIVYIGFCIPYFWIRHNSDVKKIILKYVHKNGK